MDRHDAGTRLGPRSTLEAMDFEQQSIEEQIAALDLLELTPEEREFAAGCIEEGPEALEWAEAALAVLPPIDDGGYPLWRVDPRRLTMVRRGDIHYLNFDPRRGSEQGGHRPAVVVSSDRFNRHSPVVTVVPMTHTRRKAHLPHNVEIPSGVLDDLGGTALCGQVITFSKKRLLRFVGKMPEEYMTQIDDALRHHFGL